MHGNLSNSFCQYLDLLFLTKTHKSYMDKKKLLLLFFMIENISTLYLERFWNNKQKCKKSYQNLGLSVTLTLYLSLFHVLGQV